MLNNNEDNKINVSINSTEEIKEKKFSKRKEQKQKINKIISKIPVLFIFFNILFYTIMLASYYIIPKLSNKKINKYAISVSSLGKSFAIFLIIIIILLIISFFLTWLTKCEKIPNNSIFTLDTMENMNPQQKIEYIALKTADLENILYNNYNRIPKLNNNNNDNISDEDYYIINERTEQGEIRFCRTCNQFKPDRSHHCKYCGTCYLKMDHHCIWFDNCITISNYKYFICCILYSFILLFCYLCVFSPLFRNILKNDYKFKVNISKLNAIIFTIIYIISIAYTMFTGILFIFHIMLALNNYTTFEYNIIHRNFSLFSKEKYSLVKNDNNINIKRYEPLKSKYDIGLWKNWIQIYGKNPFLWYLPIKSEFKENGFNDGINFQQNDDETLETICSI